jgi:hypothetical protein
MICRHATVSIKDRRAMVKKRGCSASVGVVEPYAMFSTIEVPARIIWDLRLYTSKRGNLAARSYMRSKYSRLS